MSILGSGSVHLSKRFRRAPVRQSGGASAVCQKCLQAGHWTYECKNDRVYNARPTRTEQLFDPKKRPRFMAPSELLPSEQASTEDPQLKKQKKKAKKAASTSSSSSSSSSSSDSSSSDESDTSSSSATSSSSSDTSSSSDSDSSSSDGSSTSSDSSTSSSDSSSSSSSDSSTSSDSSSDSESPPPRKSKKAKDAVALPSHGTQQPRGAPSREGDARAGAHRDGAARGPGAVKLRSVVVRPHEASRRPREGHKVPIVFSVDAHGEGSGPRGYGREPKDDDRWRARSRTPPEREERGKMEDRSRLDPSSHRRSAAEGKGDQGDREDRHGHRERGRDDREHPRREQGDTRERREARDLGDRGGRDRGGTPVRRRRTPEEGDDRWAGGGSGAEESRRARGNDPAKVVIRQRHAYHGLGTDELNPGAQERERSPGSASPLPSDSDISAM